MLIYGALRPQARQLVLIVAALSKVTFIGLVLAYGKPYLAQVGVSIAIDVVMVALFVGYLAAVRREA